MKDLEIPDEDEEETYEEKKVNNKRRRKRARTRNKNKKNEEVKDPCKRKRPRQKSRKAVIDSESSDHCFSINKNNSSAPCISNAESDDDAITPEGKETVEDFSDSDDFAKRR